MSSFIEEGAGKINEIVQENTEGESHLSYVFVVV
jgi:hypothetical protein